MARVEMQGRFREFTSAADMRAFYVGLRARFRALDPPPRPRPRPVVRLVKTLPFEPPPPLEPPPVILLPRAPMNRIIAHVARHYGRKPSDLRSPSRELQYVRPRRVAAYLGRELLGLSLPQIGRYLGHRHHTSVMNMLQVIEFQMRLDAVLFITVGRLRAQLLDEERGP